MNERPHEGLPAVRRETAILAGIVLLGAALRLYGLGRFSIWYDEGATLYAATLVDHPLRLLNPDWCTDPPLLPLLTRFWWDALGAPLSLDPLTERADFALRLLPCLFSMAAIPLTFALTFEVTRKRAPAHVAALLVAISPFQIYYAQELKPYSTLTVLGLGAVYCMLRVFERDRAIAWLGIILFMVLSMYNHFYSVWTIFACNVAFVLAAPRRLPVYTKWFFGQCAVIILSWPAIRQGLVINAITERVDVSWYPPLTTDVGLITFKNFFAGYAPGTAVPSLLAAMAAIFAVAGVWSLRDRYRPCLVVCVVAIVPIAGNLFLWQTREFSYYQHRLFILSAVLLTVLAAAGIANVKKRGLHIAAIASMAILTGLCLPDYYAQRLHPSEQHRLGVRYKVDNRGVANLIHAGWKPGDTVAHFSHFTLLPLRYRYLEDLPQCTIGFTEQDTLDMIHSFPLRELWDHVGALPRRIDSVAAESQRIWLVESWWEPDDLFSTARLYRAWLDLHAIRTARYPLDGVTLYLYDLSAKGMNGAHAVQAADAGDLTVPYYLRLTPKPAPFPGEPWLENFRQTMEMLATDPYARFPRLSAGSGIRSAGDEATTLPLEYVTENTGNESSALRLAVMTSAGAIVPLQFDRESPESDDWRPVQHGNPAFQGDIDEFAFSAALDRDDPHSSALTASMQLTRGRYFLYMRIWQEAGPVNTSRAAIRIAVATGGNPAVNGQMQLIHWDVIPFSEQGQSGWRWFQLGKLAQTESSTVTVRVNAHNETRLGQAFADVGRLCFVPELADPKSFGYTDPVWRSVARADNGGIVVTPPAFEGESARMDVVLYDPTWSRYRSVGFFLERP